MALVIRGKTRCHLCQRVHAPDDDVELFPPALFERGDPGFHLNDAGVHRECLLALPYGEDALRVREEYSEKWR